MAENAGALARGAEAARTACDGRALMLGVDRLDYTKGLPQRVAAFARLLETRPELAGA